MSLSLLPGFEFSFFMHEKNKIETEMIKTEFRVFLISFKINDMISIETKTAHSVTNAISLNKHIRMA